MIPLKITPTKLVAALLCAASFFLAQRCLAIDLLPQFRPIGGTGNNLANPSLDAVPGNPELNIAPLNFAAGSGTNDTLISGPNPRTISNVVSGGTGSNGLNGETDDPVASGWLYVFGQFVDHDISLENTPSGAVAIPVIVPAGDPVFAAGTRIAMTRDQRSPSTNAIINEVAGYLDLSQLYGDTTTVAASLENSNGTLKTSGTGPYPFLSVSGGAFIAGDPRVTENPELTAVTTLFMREHNYWVANLAAANPSWTPAQLYNMAKAITTAEYEHIIYSEYLPMLIGNVLPSYPGYNSSVNAQATQEFATAAFRVGHSQVSDTEQGLDNNGNVVFTESLSQAFQNSAAQDESNGVDNLLRNIGVDFAQATDVYVVPTLRNLLFAPLPGGDIDEMDLIAIDIQRERDAGLATLNQTRSALGLAQYTSFSQLTSDPILQQNLQTVYGSINNVDLFMGGLAETPAPGSKVGPTFQTIIANQFSALQTGDRFYWENEGFDAQTTQMILHTTLTDLLRRDTNTTAILQPNMFEESTFTPTSTTLPNGTYKIVNVGSGLALDVEGGSAANSTYTDTYPYQAQPWQQWIVTNLGNGTYSIIGTGSGLALDVYGAYTAPDSPVDIYTYQAHTNQQWIMTQTSNGNYTIKGVQSGNYLQATGETSTNVMNPSNGATNQQWSFQAP